MKTLTKIVKHTIILILLFSPIQVFCQYYPSGGFQGGGHGSGGLISGIEDITLPMETDALVAFPNPFHDQIRIKYTLEDFSKVKLDVFDVTSRRVVSLVPASKRHAGEHIINWSGTNAQGKKVPKGIYYFRLEVDKKVLNKKIILL